MLGAMVNSQTTSFFQMNAQIPTQTVILRMTGDSTHGTSLKSSSRMKSLRRLKTLSQVMRNATGTTAPANSKSAMMADIFTATTHAGLNTAGTTAEDMNVKSGTPLAVMNMVNGCGSLMSALKVVLSKKPLLKVSLMTSLLHSKHGALTVHAMTKKQITTLKSKMNKTGSTTSGAPLKPVPRTRDN